jgi:hypothetical protein
MTNPKDTNVVTEIKKRYGHVIDLDKSPNAIIEIIQNYRHLLDVADGPDGSAGGPPGHRVEEVGTQAVLNLILELKREVQELKAKIK